MLVSPVLSCTDWTVTDIACLCGLPQHHCMEETAVMACHPNSLRSSTCARIAEGMSAHAGITDVLMRTLLMGGSVANLDREVLPPSQALLQVRV